MLRSLIDDCWEKMSNIVILSTLYLNIPSANGLCARNLAEAFRRMGHKVFVVCYDKDTLEDEPDRDCILTVPQPVNNIRNPFQKIVSTSKVILGSIEPLLKENLVNSYYKKLCEINKMANIDAIVAMFFPFESVEAMCRFSSEYPKTKTFIYELDSVGDGVLDLVTKKVYNRVYVNWLREKYRSASFVIVMNSHKKYWINQFGNDFACKMRLADLPIITKQQVNTNVVNNSTIKMIYSGIIEKRYRPANYLLSVLQELEKKIDYEFSFFSKGDCEKDIAQTAKKVKSIKQCGYISPNELLKITSNADFLISIGNRVSRSVPSKLISYISYGKPIIHFSSQIDDVCKEYLLKYPLALIISQNDSVEKSVERIIQFISETKGKVVSFSRILELFKENSAEFSCDLLNELIEDNNEKTLK